MRDYQHSFARVKWAALVLDEAQRVKNPAAGVTNAVKTLQADFVLALTGTPVENRLADLWSIMDRVSPGALGALVPFQAAYERPLAETPGEELERLGRELRAKLTAEPSPLMKRRMKSDHLPGLPDKTHHALREPMCLAQARAYDEILAEARRARSRSQRLGFVQRLRHVSLHAALGLDVTARIDPDELVKRSARLRPTLAALDAIAQRKEKALVFVDLLDFQGHLQQLLQRRYDLAAPPMLISGDVSSAERKARVDRFQRVRGHFDVMILSPKAGGVGLTLTAANHVIHLTRWWNPAVEDQATDRVHRLGQDRPVSVYVSLAIHPRISERSFDVLLDRLMTNKRALSGAVLTPVAPSDDELDHVLDAALSG